MKAYLQLHTPPKKLVDIITRLGSPKGSFYDYVARTLTERARPHLLDFGERAGPHVHVYLGGYRVGTISDYDDSCRFIPTESFKVYSPEIP